MRSLTVLMALALSLAAAHASAEVAKTYRSIDLYGYTSDVDLRPGDKVSAHTPSGLACGECEVRKQGVYGFLHVYGDDPGTPEVEGAQDGEAITLKHNGVPVAARGPDQPVWTRDGEELQVNIAASEAAEPTEESGGGGGCFIATAAFGSPLEGRVAALKEFRGRYLATHRAGRLFVRLYASHSPPMARFIASRQRVRTLTRLSLYPVAAAAAAATSPATSRWHWLIGPMILLIVLMILQMTLVRGTGPGPDRRDAGSSKVT